MLSRSIMASVKESSLVDASHEGGDTSAKTPATPGKKGSGPPSAKKPFGGYPSEKAETHRMDSPNGDNPDDKDPDHARALGALRAVDSPKNPSANPAEAEILDHIRSTNDGLTQAHDSMAELSKSLSDAAASASKVEKLNGITPIKDKHYCAVLATRPPHTDVRKYIF